ncbi:hypothetical protein TUM20985_25090 [Mycobacterium antarcticum]|nr:hypothetical protein TUM20985_25090 [Mycolicibacterium sp. TUM20985]
MLNDDTVRPETVVAQARIVSAQEWQVADPRLIAQQYQKTRERVVGLLADPDADWTAPVATCPGWSVRDVVAHLAAVAEDISAGTLTGAPTDEQTAAQVARFDGHDHEGIVAAWTAAAGRLDRNAAASGVAPPLADAVCHEHDVRHALGRPGARDSDAVWSATEQLLTMLVTPRPLRVIVEDAEYVSGPDGPDEVMLRTTRFEAVRWRTGRRSRAQLAAMNWSDDPTEVLDHLYLFGPARRDIAE